jgi:flagellar biosynthesis protein FlhF
MNVKRFVGKNAREAMAQARAAFGEDAVVLSNRPVPGGVEILATAGAEIGSAARAPAAPALQAPADPAAARPRARPARAAAPSAAAAAPAAADDGTPMSTVSFQQFVRERQRQEAETAKLRAAAGRAAEQIAGFAEPAAAAPAAPAFTAPARRAAPVEPGRFAREALAAAEAEAAFDPLQGIDFEASRPPVGPAAYSRIEGVKDRDGSEEVMAELRQLRNSISQQLSTMAWFDSVRRSPAQTRLLRTLLGNGFSATLTRRLVEKLPEDLADAQADAWLLNMLAHNLRTSGEDCIQNRGGVYALVGPTGVGKTTTTAKIAANFALKHGPASVGLITVDTYRMAAGDQLRAFGKILGIPVHTARDAASLADLLDLFGGKKLVLVDTVGVGQRDRRLPELFAALPQRRLQRLLVLNAAVQGETLDEVVQAYSSGPGTRCVISKLDESARCGGAIDVAIRHQLVVEGIANGQRVPEDWHAARGTLLAQKALMRPSGSFAPDENELGLVLTMPPAPVAGAGRA